MWSVDYGLYIKAISKAWEIFGLDIISSDEWMHMIGVCTDSHIRIYHLSAESEIVYFKGHIGVASTVKIFASSSRTSYQIISTGYDRNERIWEQEAGKGEWCNV
jgi:hypothetical protein